MSLQSCPESTLFAESDGYVVARSATITERAQVELRLRPKYAPTERTVRVSYLDHGPAGAPVIIAQGGISASRDVCTTAAAGEGWWSDLIGPGRALDSDRFRVLAIDWLDVAQLGGAPAVSSDDQADALAALLDTLGIARAAAFVGASYGAMVGLSFAARHGTRLDRLVAISGTHRAHPLATALRTIQRNIVRHGIACDDSAGALSLARQLAMTTYRGAVEFAERFDVEPEYRNGRFHFAVEDYLQAAGAKFVARFDAQRFLDLSESIDLHRLDPATVRVPTDVIAVDSDRLVPLADCEQLAGAIGAPTRLHVVDSPYGHDAFLKEPVRIGALLRSALSC
jgi:homoserine O-acetyltransferase/O-succinyltransferase